MNLRVGVLVPSREAFMQRDYDPAPLLAFAERAEDLGFDSLWVGDSPLARPRFDPLTLLAALAARTRRATLGTAILLPVLRQPLLLAHGLATLDRIAGGRLVVGVGAGAAVPSIRAEHEAIGVPFDERISRLREMVRLWRALWGSTTSASGFSGRHWRLESTDLLPKPTRGTIPIWYGGGGPRMLRFTAEELDGWFPTAPSVESFAQGVAALEGAPAKKAGVTRALYYTITADADRERALATQRAYAEAYYGAPLELLATVQGFFAGSLDDCVARLREFVAAGAEHLVIRFGSLDAAGQLELFARQALPALR